MKKKIILASLIGLAVTSCNNDKFLTVIPQTALSSATFFTKEADFVQAVNATYVPLRAMYNEAAWAMEEMHSDNTYYARNVLFGAVENTQNIADFAILNAGGLTANTIVLNMYRLNYQIIARANQVLSVIDKVEFSGAAGAESKNNLKGQAHFLRGFAYFQLARLFGKAPMHLTPVANREEAASPLATTADLYNQVEKDLLEGVKLLPVKSKQEAGRATSGAARTALANLYMVQKKWAEAEKLLAEIVASGEYSLMADYNDAFSTTSGNKNNRESVFEVQYLEGAAGLNGNQIYRFIPTPITAEELKPITGTSNPQAISGENNNIPTPDLIAAYEPGDKRKDISIGSVTLSQSLRENKTYPYIKKYARTHAQHNNTGQNWPIYRYAEVLLFLAEALNEQGKTGEAVPYLNQVRSRAGLAATTAASQAAMRDAIYRERRVELAFENKRWYDLVRTGRVKDVITAYGARIKANPQDYYFPKGAVPPPNAFTNLEDYYPLPAVEAALTPHF
ncbi:RagB/SusD family nutrient uptake outer membrane protein [Nibrella saemangeumensis]|uniref:RagB/SusD family nutrient uptake outer membrane protein n=1 Tax=Nibrella saemangeumensis TaxID=1084526 RepID=A0ABP8MR01_9BACT